MDAADAPKVSASSDDVQDAWGVCALCDHAATDHEPGEFHSNCRCLIPGCACHSLVLLSFEQMQAVDAIAEQIRGGDDV